MRLKEKILVNLLEKHRGTYLKLKKIDGLGIAVDDGFLDLHAKLLRESRGIQTLSERYNLYSLAKATSHLPGALAEAGVYRGGSAKILCLVKGDSPLYLFDTFEGMPEVNAAVDGVFSRGDFANTRYDEVAAYLSEFRDVHLYQGIFPGSAAGKEPEKLSYRFVHLDLDIYESTFQALEFFYPRMVSGGLIVSHDYNRLCAPGVKKAFTEFFRGRREPIIPLWETQCVVTKL